MPANLGMTEPEIKEISCEQLSSGLKAPMSAFAKRLAARKAARK